MPCRPDHIKLERRQPEHLLDIPEAALEAACAAHWNCGLWPGQNEWSRIVEADDHRVPLLRLKMQAALSAAIAAGMEVNDERSA